MDHWVSFNIKAEKYNINEEKYNFLLIYNFFATFHLLKTPLKQGKYDFLT